MRLPLKNTLLSAIFPGCTLSIVCSYALPLAQGAILFSTSILEMLLLHQLASLSPP
jgi:hypothetical protein